MCDDVKYLLKFGGGLLTRVRKYHDYIQKEDRGILFQRVLFPSGMLFSSIIL